MRADVDLVVPVKTLQRAKTRLVGVTDDRPALALAFALDTITAALPAVRRVLAVTEDPAVAAELRAMGVDSAPGPEGLNEALRFGAAMLRQRDRRCVVGALQADLPALRTAELRAALAAAESRAFCPDRQGTGTTLLLSAPGGELEPEFGVGSAEAHSAGAQALIGPWPSLRNDVDTAEDLELATGLGLGPRTREALSPVC
ncbi:2-phospho-L-lactate guanylyltransferase [Saccharothrix algeriensis]|uniref:Phosphoenolpyruvate guanylyltransferase n=1 Tax=Saccharothrix algeriensis TaxID=173560 RepID=A0A8T8HTJ5_9PSEU|nr:2-phospho-L-lactate guanylyltransferase [Saccharothrix algeriensis]MBM7813322.1 2-phospho-L-lactate guanylyltransferase [Saccharothrix algeriensis]QTR01865.1 2-phospho-L-lactate guanylyltransferase [Saccharothrix algeriensis]